jgi:8-oxo-dGTP diphosphatase
MKEHNVVAAIIQKQNQFLCLQRGPNKYEYISHKFEFPGGKQEENESKEEALIREIKEELNIEIDIVSEYLTVHHTYPDFKLIMHSFLCTAKDYNFQLSEHIDFKWLKAQELDQLDWAAADIPIVEKLMSEINGELP